MRTSTRLVRHRRHFAGAAAIVAGALACVGVVSAQADPPPSRPVPLQVGPNAISAGLADGSRPSVSGDGRWVVFQGSDPAGRTTIFRTDRQTGTVVELSPVPDGVRIGDTVNPVVSSDGCVVVAQTQMPLDLFRDNDQDTRWDVYRLVVPECGGRPGGWELVSLDNLDGIARDDIRTADAPTVSASGAVIAFSHPASGRPDGVSTITVVDVTVPVGAVGRNTEVAGMPVEAPATVFRYRGARQPALSANGRHLAFVSDTTAAEPLPGWGEGQVRGGWATSQVFAWDRADTDVFTAVELVSASNGTPAIAGAGDPAISEDGRIVVFTSTDQGLVDARYSACPNLCHSQIFRFDRDPDANGIFDEPVETTPLSIVSAVDAGAVELGRPIAGNHSSWDPAVNADGTEIAFVTDASNLLSTTLPGGGTDADGDILVAETGIGVLHRVSDELADGAIPGAHARPAMDDTGQVVVFDSLVADRFEDGVQLNGRHIVATTSSPTLSLSALEFGTVLVGWDSEELYVSVLNSGPGAFAPSEVTSSSPNFRVTGGTCAAGVLVPAGEYCTVYVVFNPTAPSGFAGTLTVSGGGFEPESVSAQLGGAGGEPTLQANPPGIDLEGGVVGTVAGRRTIDVKNISFAPTSIASIELDGVDPGDFAIVGQSCTNRALNPQASCTVEIEFRPTAAGYRSALVLVGTPLGQYTSAIVSGQGSYAPQVAAANTSVAPGGLLGLGGEGFPVASSLSIRFADSGSAFWLVDSNSAGSFLVQAAVPLHERPGPRTVIVTGPHGVSASVDVFVEPRQRLMPGIPGSGLG